MVDSAGSPTLELPEDVFREICHWAAQDESSKASCCSLARVSKEAQAIMEPILYRDLNFSGLPLCDLLERTIEHHPTKPPNFFETTVKSIRVTFSSQRTHFVYSLFRIMRTCTGIEEYHNPHPMAPYRAELENTIRKLYHTLEPPKHLTISQTAFPRDSRNLTHRIFANVTHLCLYSHGVGLNWDWGNLPSFSQLTHLLIQLDSETGGANRLNLTSQLTESSTLRCILLDDAYTRRKDLVDDILLATRDKRVVVSYKFGVLPSFAEGIFEPGVWVRRNAVSSSEVTLSLLWQLGEEKVEERQQGVVEWPPSPPGWLENGPLFRNPKPCAPAPRRLSI